MNQEHQLSIGYTYYIKGTETLVTPDIEITLDRFDNRIDLSNYLDNYGTYKYTFNVNDDNFNSFSTSVNFDIYIAKLTTSTSLDHDTNGGTAYTSLDDAIIASQNMTSQSYIYVYGDAVIGELYNELTLGANTELYLPYSNTEGYEEYGVSTGLSDSEYTSPQLYLTITISENVRFTVHGKITIGGYRSQNTATKQNVISVGYSQIVNNGVIELYGTLNAFGYILQGDENQGQLVVHDTGIVYEPFIINNWRGGSSAAGVYGVNTGYDILRSTYGQDGDIVPFNKYYMDKIQTSVTFEKGSKWIGYAAIWTQEGRTGWNTTNYNVIGDSSSLLEIQDGNIVKQYNVDDGKTYLIINGTVSDHYGALTINLYVDIILSTEHVYFAIPYTLGFIVENGATLNINYKYKMLPGSSLEIKEGGTVNINQNGKLIVYKDYKETTPSSTKYPNDKDEPKLIVNGVLNVYGGFAGIATSTETGILNLTNASSLELDSKDGYGTINPNINLEEIFQNIGSIIGGTELFYCNVTSWQKLAAYNAQALDITVNWDTSGNLPYVLDPYKLEKKQYVWNGSMWIENIFSVNIDSNIDYGESSITGSFGTVINENNLPIPVGATIQIDNVFYSLEGYYMLSLTLFKYIYKYL